MRSTWTMTFCPAHLVTGADLQVLGRHGPAAPAHVQQPVAIPDGVDTGRPLGYLPVRPVLEAVKWPGLQLPHGKGHRPDANRLAHESIREQMTPAATGQRRQRA